MDGLKGRIVGRTSDGRILVSLTAEEYLGSLPLVATPGGILMSILGERPVPREAPAAPRQPAAIRPAVKECEFCKKPYTPLSRRQRTCGAVKCKKALKSQIMEAYHAKRKAKTGTPLPAPAAGKPAAMTPEQKQARLAAIRAAMGRVKARDTGAGVGRGDEEPAELAQARREAAGE